MGDRNAGRYLLTADGHVPNNERLPLLVYRAAVVLPPARGAEHLARLFASHGWRGAWVDGIYDFHHYHAGSHEVLGLAAGHARVQLGGRNGPHFELGAGDVVVIPAGVGHCRIDRAPGLVVVGAYPEGQEDWDLKRDTAADYRQALDEIPRVPCPRQDPVHGARGPLLALWR